MRTLPFRKAASQTEAPGGSAFQEAGRAPPEQATRPGHRLCPPWSGGEKATPLAGLLPATGPAGEPRSEDAP